METRTSFKNRDAARIFAGFVIVGIGTVLLMRNLGYFVPRWIFSWPMILILVGLYSGVKHNFRNPAWMIITGIGSFFLVTKFIPEINISPAFWPVLIIAAGVLFIIRPNPKWRNNRFSSTDQDPTVRNTQELELVEAPGETGDTIKIDSVFSGIDRSVLSKNFRGGRISCVFGGAEVDFLQAELGGRAVLKMDVVFGGAKLIIPSHWAVQSQIDGVFHSVEDKRKYSPATGTDTGKLLILTGSCVFGGIEIKSY